MKIFKATLYVALIFLKKYDILNRVYGNFKGVIDVNAKLYRMEKKLPLYG